MIRKMAARVLVSTRTGSPLGCKNEICAGRESPAVQLLPSLSAMQRERCILAATTCTFSCAALASLISAAEPQSKISLVRV